MLLGTGTGSFGSPAQYTVGGSGEAIAIADFTGDGVPDIVAGTALLAGTGNGTFSAGPPPPVGAAIIWAFAAGDLDGDGIMDLVYADTENELVVPLFGKGDGTFTTGPGYAVSQFPDSLVLADYNNDGRLDIINGSGDARIFGPADQSGTTDILLNNGDGTFQGVPEYPSFLLSDEMGAAIHVRSRRGRRQVRRRLPRRSGIFQWRRHAFHGRRKGGLSAPAELHHPAGAGRSYGVRRSDCGGGLQRRRIA